MGMKGEPQALPMAQHSPTELSADERFSESVAYTAGAPKFPEVRTIRAVEWTIGDLSP